MLMPAFVVDHLPIGWRRPGNLHVLRHGSLHFCTDPWVRTIEWNGRVVAKGKELFPIDHVWD